MTTRLFLSHMPCHTTYLLYVKAGTLLASDAKEVEAEPVAVSTEEDSKPAASPVPEKPTERSSPSPSVASFHSAEEDNIKKESAAADIAGNTNAGSDGDIDTDIDVVDTPATGGNCKDDAPAAGSDDNDRDADAADTGAAASDSHSTEGVTYASPRNFAERLMKALETKLCPDGLWWTGEGKAIALSTKNLKESSLLQDYFKVTQYSGFIRNLNRW